MLRCCEVPRICSVHFESSTFRNRTVRVTSVNRNLEHPRISGRRRLRRLQQLVNERAAADTLTFGCSGSTPTLTLVGTLPACHDGQTPDRHNETRTRTRPDGGWRERLRLQCRGVDSYRPINCSRAYIGTRPRAPVGGAAVICESFCSVGLLLSARGSSTT